MWCSVYNDDPAACNNAYAQKGTGGYGWCEHDGGEGGGDGGGDGSGDGFGSTGTPHTSSPTSLHVPSACSHHP